MFCRVGIPTSHLFRGVAPDTHVGAFKLTYQPTPAKGCPPTSSLPTFSRSICTGIAFDEVGGNIFHVGEAPGQAQAVKLLNNFLSATAMAATSEAVLFGQKYGVDISTILDCVNVSSGRNTASADKFPNRVVTGTYDAGFATALMTKDVALYLEQVRVAGTPDEIGSVVSGRWNAVLEDMPESDFTEIYRHIAGETQTGE